MKDSQLIAVAGVVGVGKTTLAQQLSDLMGAPLICEEYDRNPFLGGLLGGDDSAALPTELCFLASRACQLHRDVVGRCSPVVTDYLFEMGSVFAQINLGSEELAFYRQAERTLGLHVVRPRAVVYLQDSAENCLERVAARGREFEGPITLEWLDCLAGAYDELFEDWDYCPVLSVDCREYDCRERQTAEYVVEGAVGTGRA